MNIPIEYQQVVLPMVVIAIYILGCYFVGDNTSQIVRWYRVARARRARSSGRVDADGYLM